MVANTTTNNMVQNLNNILNQIKYMDKQLLKFSVLYANTPVEQDVAMKMAQFEMQINQLSAKAEVLINYISKYTYNYRM